MSNILQNLFNDGIAAGMDKNEILMKLVTEGGLDVTSAVREYSSLAKKAGVVLSSSARQAKVNAMLEGVDITDSATRSDMVEKIADQFDVSEATATADIKKYAETNEIELPSQHRNKLEDMVQFVKDQMDEGVDRAGIVMALQSEMGYSENSAASALSRARKELGLTEGRSKGNVAPISDLVAFVRKNQDTPRKQLSEMMADELGYTTVTSYAFLSYLNFAREWARQELSEYKASQAG